MSEVTVPVVIHAEWYPHIIESILNHVCNTDHSAALRLRGACREWATRIEQKIFRHVRLKLRGNVTRRLRCNLTLTTVCQDGPWELSPVDVRALWEANQRPLARFGDYFKVVDIDYRGYNNRSPNLVSNVLKVWTTIPHLKAVRLWPERDADWHDWAAFNVETFILFRPRYSLTDPLVLHKPTDRRAPAPLLVVNYEDDRLSLRDIFPDGIVPDRLTKYLRLVTMVYDAPRSSHISSGRRRPIS